MLDELKEKIKNKKLILIGEIHGTKEIPELLSHFFLEFSKKEDFNVCFEIPGEFQDNYMLFFKNKELKDGRNSKEYFNLLQNLKNKNISVFFIGPTKAKTQEEAEKEIAENILKNLNDKKTFAILGNIHASKKPIHFIETEVKTAGSILYDKFGNKMFGINIHPEKGEFFNFGPRKIDKNFSDKSFNKNFDYVHKIKKVSPCSF